MKHEIIGGALTLPDGKALPLSKAVRAGDFVFVSGQLGLNAQGRLVGEGVEAQARQALQNIATILAEAGASLSHVVKASVWLTDRGDFGLFNQVYVEYFGSHPPARSMVVCELVLLGARVEIEVLAYAP